MVELHMKVSQTKAVRPDQPALWEHLPLAVGMWLLGPGSLGKAGVAPEPQAVHPTFLTI